MQILAVATLGGSPAPLLVWSVGDDQRTQQFRFGFEHYVKAERECPAICANATIEGLTSIDGRRSKYRIDLDWRSHYGLVPGSAHTIDGVCGPNIQACSAAAAELVLKWKASTEAAYVH